MNRLKNLRCYLAGPIDHAEDDGVEWRKMMTKWLKERKVKVLDPCDKPLKNAYYRGIEGEKAKMFELKNTGRYFELSRRMKEIVHMDLRMVDVSDIVIVYLDLESKPFGTTHELLNALHQRKPTLVVIEGGIAKAPNWLFGIMDFNFMFDNFEDVQMFLSQIDNETIEGDLSRWVFFE